MSTGERETEGEVFFFLRPARSLTGLSVDREIEQAGEFKALLRRRLLKLISHSRRSGGSANTREHADGQMSL